MIRNYIKIACRNLKKHQQFSLINILGLSMALTVSLAILLYVDDELSYDGFHPDADQLYRITMNTKVAEKDFHSAWTPPFIAARMKDDLPEVENYVTLYKHFKGFSIKKDNEEIAINDVYYSSPNFFEVFGLELKFGNPKNVLANPENIVLSEELAKMLFPGEPIMGKIIETTNGPKKITGIISKTNHNSHFHPAIITSIVGHWNIKELASALNFDASFYNYIVLSKDSRISQKKMTQIADVYSRLWLNADENRRNSFGNQKIEFELQQIQDIHLESNLEFEMEANGNKSIVQIFLLVSILILIVASINYTNLASARYLERIKELGIRKVLGSTRWQLATQFFIESFIITFLAALLAVITVQLLLPAFNSLSGKALAFEEIFQLRIMVGLLIIVFGCAFISSIYPTIFISNIKAISIFHVNNSGMGKGNRFRKIMLVMQISASGILMIFTLVLIHQLRFMQNYDLGFHDDQVIVVEVKTRDARTKIPALKNELQKLKDVKSVGLTGQIPGDENLKTEPFGFESNEGAIVEMLTNYMFSGPDIVSSLGLQVNKGSNFNPEKGGANRGQEVLVNQTLVNAMNWQDPIGKKVNLPIGEAWVVGVINDFHLKSLHHKIEPLTIIYLDNWAEVLLIKVNTNDLSQMIKSIEEIHDQVLPNTTFEFSFLNDTFSQQYKSDRQQASLFTVFSIITIIIAAMGLMGLVGFSLVRRSKEISIRRVFGANYVQVIFLLFKEYGGIMLVGFLIVVPVANYLIKEWLLTFPYKIDLSPVHFIVPILSLVVLISLIIISRSYSTARKNPSRVLKDE